jgi:hypothetical protein
MLMKKDSFMISLICGLIHHCGFGESWSAGKEVCDGYGEAGPMVPKVVWLFFVLEAYSSLVTDDTHLMRHGRLKRRKGQRQQSRSQRFVLF